jgi:hypothetical protein
MYRIRKTPNLKSIAAIILLFALTHDTSHAGDEVDKEFLRHMVDYSETLQRRILAEGRPLTEEERELARRAGIKDIDRVRILLLDAVPLPENEELRQRLAEIGFLQLIGQARGTAKGYGVILTQSGQRRRTDLAHELIHVAQYERLGGIAAAMAYHLPDLIANGYRRSTLEDEAFRLAPAIVDPR